MSGTSIDNFSFNLIGTESAPFAGYISSDDPTRVSPQVMVRGSQNVLLQNTGNIANREGKKLYDPADDTDDPVVTSFDWSSPDGELLLVRVLTSGKLQFYNTPDSTWYTIYTYPTTNTDISFAKWWDLTNSKELLVMCNGTPNLYAWSGGVSQSVGAVNTQNSMILTASDLFTTFSAGTNASSYAISFGDQGNQIAIVFEENVDMAYNDIVLTMVRSSPAASEVATIVITNNISGTPDPNFALVLRGMSKEQTAQNVISLLQNPSANTGTQKGFTDADVLSLLGDVVTTSVPSLESGNGETWASQGFLAPTGTIVVNGVEYTYTQNVGNYLVNISGTPPEGFVAYSSLVITPNSSNTGGDITYPSMEDFNNDFLLCLNNQLIVCSYSSRIVHISFNERYTLFTQGGDVIIGDPDFIVLDEFPKGGTIRGDSAYIGAGQSAWYEVTPNTSIPFVADQFRTVYTKVTKFSGAGLSAPLGFNFVTTWGEDIVYVDQQNQLRTLGVYRNVFTQKSPSLSLAVREQLQEEDFTGGCIRAVGEYIYMIAPISGLTYLYQIRDDVDDVGNISSQRLWQPPQSWGIVRVAIVNGIPHGYSAETPQLYQLFDTNQWHDDTSEVGVYSPYISVARFAYRQSQQRSKLIGYDKVYYEGYILPDSDLTANVYYDYRGATGLDEIILSDNGDNPVLYGGNGVTLIGGSIIGNTTIGGGRRDEDYSNPLPKFRAIANIGIKNSFEYQLELVSENLDSRWQLIALGANEVLVTDRPVNLQKQT